MARILVSGVPTIGQANPSFALVAALAAAGHDVDYLLTEAFRAPVERAGATLLPYASYLHGKPVNRPLQALGARVLFNELSREVLDRAGDYDLVVAAGVQPQFARLESSLSIPVVRFSPMFWQNQRTIAELAPRLKALPGFVRLGLGTGWLRRAASQVIGRTLLGNQGHDVIDLLGPQSSTLNLTVSSRYFQPRADDFDDSCVYLGPTSAPTQADAFPLERIRQHPGPVIYASLGTIYNGWTGYFRTIARAFADTDALVVITRARPGADTDLGAVADNVLVFDDVPQAAVLRHADLCFTHGGFGTITDAGLAGVPMVVTPMGGDQFLNAYRLAELDAATVLPATKVSVDRVRQQGQAILNRPRPSAGLAALSASFRDSGGVALGVARIEALLGTA